MDYSLIDETNFAVRSPVMWDFLYRFVVTVTAVNIQPDQKTYWCVVSSLTLTKSYD